MCWLLPWGGSALAKFGNFSFVPTATDWKYYAQILREVASGRRTKRVAQYKCGLLVLDHLQLMEPSNRTDGRERQVTECSRTIKTRASELRIPIIVLAQLNDDGRSREIRAIELLQSQPNHIELVTERLTLRTLLSQDHTMQMSTVHVMSCLSRNLFCWQRT